MIEYCKSIFDIEIDWWIFHLYVGLWLFVKFMLSFLRESLYLYPAFILQYLASVHSCIDTLAVDGNYKISIVPFFCMLSLSLLAATSTFTLRAWACLGPEACVNSEKYMNSKTIFSFYHVLLTCSPRCIIVIVLAMLCLQDTINKLYLHTWSPSHCTLCLFACLLIKIQL